MLARLPLSRPGAPNLALCPQDTAKLLSVWTVLRSQEEKLLRLTTLCSTWSAYPSTPSNSTHPCVRMYVLTHAHMHTLTHSRMPTCELTYTHTTSTHSHAHCSSLTHTHMHSCMCTYTHIHTHTVTKVIQSLGISPNADRGIL